MKKATANTNAQLTTIKSDIETLAKDVTSLLTAVQRDVDAVGGIDGLTTEAKQQLQTLTKQVNAFAQGHYAASKDQVKDFAAKTQKRVEEKPLESAATALGIGVIAGALLTKWLRS